MSCQSSTLSPATAALNSLVSSSSNKRVKRSTMDSPNASPFAFDMSALFESSDEESLAFPSIEWSFDTINSNTDDDDDDDKSVSSTSSTLSDSSSLGKRSRTGGLTRTKKARSSIDLLG